MKAKSTTTVLIIILLLSPLLWRGAGGEAFAQNTFRYQICPDVGPKPRWNVGEKYGGNVALHQVPSDSGYITFTNAGREIKYYPGIPDDSLEWPCFAATKLDKYGNLKWIRAYQDKSGATIKIPHDGVPTSDSGFIMAGQKNVRGNPYYNGTNSYVQKMDKNGNLKWAKQYKITGSEENMALKILQMPDDGYIVMGQTKDLVYSSNPNPGEAFNANYNIYLLRLDKDGNRVWCYYYDAKQNGVEYPTSLSLTADGGFIIGGSAFNINNNPNTPLYGFSALMMKVSGDGKTVEWARRHGRVLNAGDTYPYYPFDEVKQTPDSGYIAVGQAKGETEYHRSRGWVVKTTKLGVVEWQKTYDTWSNITNVEILNDGYLLGSTESEPGNSSAGNGYGRLTKITDIGEVEWSKLYSGGGINDLNLTVDGGFIMDFFSSGFSKGTYTPEQSIIKTNRLGEFDNGCMYNDNVVSNAGSNIDTAYTLTSTSVNLSPTDLPLQVFFITRDICPVACGISDKPIAPLSIGGSGCANSDTPINASPEWAAANYSHYKIDFGDPASGINNYILGSSIAEGYYGQVWHNYANPGTYTITMIVYNNDYTLSDTVLGTAVIIPKPLISLSTPSIHVCTKDTVTITATIENYTPGPYSMRWKEETFYTTYTNQTILSETYILQDSILTAVATVLADTSQKYYVYGNSSHAANVCIMSDTVKVIVGDNEAIITGDTKICKGATASLKATGGDTYLWSTGSTTKTITVSPTANSTYWVEAVTTDGCRDTGYVYVQVISKISVDVFADKKAVCMGDQAKLHATGAMGYNWNTGDKTDTAIVTASAGKNTFIVTGTNGLCTDTASIVIMGDIKPVGTLSSLPVNTSGKACYLSTYTLTASGGDSYYWPYYSPAKQKSPNPIQLSSISTGAFTDVVYVYNGGCADTVELSTASPAYSPDVYGINADECRVCPGTEVTLRKQSFYYEYSVPTTHNNNLTYIWSNGTTGAGLNDSTKVTVNSDTTISLTTTNGDGCSTTRSILLYANPHFYIKKEASAVASCDNTPTTLYLLGDQLDSFMWNDGSTNDTLVSSLSNDAWVSITATAEGCTRTDSVFVPAKSNLPKATITGNPIVCTGTPTTYSVSGNAPITSYRWLSDDSTNPTITLSPSTNITLKALLTFSLGCTDTASYTIKVKDATTPTVSGNTQICPNGTVALTATGGYTYQWNTGSSSNKIKITTPKDSAVQVIISNNGCRNDTLSVTITTNKTITATLFSDADTICSGTALTLIAGGGDAYNWSTGEQGETIGILPSINTTYEVNAQLTADNCADTASITITVKPSPTLSVSGQTTLCSGKSATLQAIGNGTGYLWNTGESTANITVSPPQDSSYSVSTFIEDCSVSQNLVISVIPSTSISAGDDQTVLSGTEITLLPSGGTGLYYNWSTTDGLICSNCNTIYENPTKTTTYYLIETNSICAEDSVTIYVLNCVGLFVPTAFSPNNDRVNDVLYIKNDCIKQLDFKIFDRWGNKVFESTNVSNGWDGTFKGEAMDPAVFVYYVNAVLLSGDPINTKGNISLVR